MQADPQDIFQDLRTNQPNAKGSERNREYWQKIIDDQRKSQLSQKRFCDKNNISFNQFYYQKQLISASKNLPCVIAPIVIKDEKLDKSTQTIIPSQQVSDSLIFEWASGNKLLIPSSANVSRLKQIILLLGELA